MNAPDIVPKENPEAFARTLYGDAALGTGESVASHAQALVEHLGNLRVDASTIDAAWLFALPEFMRDWRPRSEARFGAETAALIDGLARLHKLRDVTREAAQRELDDEKQVETLRKMMLAMVADVRVVLIRLASRLQTMQYFTRHSAHPQAVVAARETLGLYAPLANRLGVWQFKWALEDLAFRLLEPQRYEELARLIDAQRGTLEGQIERMRLSLSQALTEGGIAAEISGRPKHIYSIHSKMRSKGLAFSEVLDLRALRILVNELPDCYAALSAVHQRFTAIDSEFDDYIARPKANHYRSLHTAVVGEGGAVFEVQIRTQEMHQHAELGVAAHWRYKEARVTSSSQAVVSSGGFDEKVALLRQLMAWRDEVGGELLNKRSVAFDDAIYALTPQGRVVDLSPGATPVDFAYTLHTDLGHRCRGARVDGAMVPLNTPLFTGQQVEIIAAKTGGPSRDWLNPALGYLASNRARGKVRQWFNAQQLAETLAQGRAIVERELQRLGKTGVNLEELASKLGFVSLDALFHAAALGDWSLRHIAQAFEAPESEAPREELALKKSRSGEGGRGVLIVGVDRLMTQLARCCKPAPPDAIGGFVTRGKGVSIHRSSCRNFQALAKRDPERVIESHWGVVQEGLFSVDIRIEAQDRPGLLRDVGEVLARERVNVTATRSQSRDQVAHMAFTVEVADLARLSQALKALHGVAGVMRAERR